MGRRKRILSGSLAAVMLIGLYILIEYLSQTGRIVSQGKGRPDSEAKVSILFTHDLHSHLDTTILEDGSTLGGLGKLDTFIKDAKARNPKTFVVDGGDFSMGTLYQTIYETRAVELTMLGQMGFDATTIGNHEFDYRGEGFANMLDSALANAEEAPALQLPALLSANIDWSKNTSKDNRKVKKALDNYGSTAYTIIERDGVKVGIFGVMGRDSEVCAPESGIVFEDIIETSKSIVKKLEAENVDMIICLSHSGTWEEPERSEDELLAKAVPEIDVIVSGHTHSIIDGAIVYDNTHIVSAGSYGINMGEIELIKSENGRWKMNNVMLHPMDSSVKTSEEISRQLSSYKEEVNEIYLGNFGYTFEQVLAENTVPFNRIEEIVSTKSEEPLGNLISDAYIYAVQQAEGEDYENVYMAVVPSGIIRESLDRGEITVAEVFNISSLGIGPDRIPGYPLVSIYLTGKEIKTAAEVDASISPLMDGTILFPSGVGWEYNPNRLFLNRVTNVWEMKDDGGRGELEDEQLYRVAADLYSAQMLSAVESKSYGLLSIVPKDKSGKPVTNFEKQIVYNLKNGSEVKTWAALANYLESFEKIKDVSVVPDKYQKLEGRKIITDSKTIIELLKNPNKIFFMVCGVVLFVVLVIVFIIFFLRRLINNHKNKKNMLY